MAHDLTPLQASAYQRYADVLRTYAGPILEEASVLGYFTQSAMAGIARANLGILKAVTLKPCSATRALPRDGGLQPQAKAAAAGAAPEEAMQAVGTDLAEGSGLAY